MTERQKTLWLDEAGERWLDDRQALPGRIKPADVANMAVFLGSDAAKMCSGQFFTVDGGLI
jgi:NAD(P)-dependent dehydrogenase (short-subunit alcohol dehydrogenase family)